jgi:bifunctional DNA-binding transcriptional regulator/antitoxin component of YhaV-PrlF toxin-antitoxin module
MANMPRMTTLGRPRLRRDEQLITALVPARPAGPPPAPAPLPMLPALGLPAGTQPGDLLVETARLDASGRLTGKALLRALGWGSGHRVGIAVTDGVLIVGSAPSGLHVVGDRGELALPAAARRMCGITPGPPVLLVAALPRDVLIVHPAHLIAQVLADWYTGRVGDRDGC